MTTAQHHLTLQHHPTAAPTRRYAGSCSCGWRSSAGTTAGMIHGAHGAHQEALSTPRVTPEP